MKKFMNENFLLKNEYAVKLYNNYAKDMPIFDYHCHVNVNEILEDKKYDNITQVWLYADHYKWRAMRLFGIEEKYITGDASDYEKFLAYAKTVSSAIGNPLYHWTHLELKKYFGIDEVLNEKTAPEIWEKTRKVLLNGLTTRKMIEISNVKALCSTDDPIDDLISHKKLNNEEGFSINVLPTFRPDRAVEIDGEGFPEYIKQLGKSA
ncbi:MAG: glucuronate isomerase, partial [Proteocatella sp.]